MMFRSHVTLGSAIIVGGAAALSLMVDRSWGLGPVLDTSGVVLSSGVAGAASAVAGWFVPWDVLSPVGLMISVLCVVLVWIGFGLPDADSSTSKLGRHIPTLGPHRGLLHSDWMVYVLVLASIPEMSRPLLWLAVGYWSHLELDGFSRAGRARWYPLGSGWRTITFKGEPMVVRKNWKGLYRANQPSERWFGTTVLILSLLPVIGVVMAWLMHGIPPWLS